MRFWDRAALKVLFVPGGILVLGITLFAYLGWLNLTVPAINFLFYCAVFGGMLLAWRFHSSRSFLSFVVILIAHQAVISTLGGPHFLPTQRIVSVLLPANFILIALMHERGFSLEAIAPIGLFLFLQTLTATVLVGAGAGRPSALVHPYHAPHPIELPYYAVYVLAGTALLLLFRFSYTRKPVDSALLWSLCAIVLALRYQESVSTSALYWTAAGCVLAASLVENSYLLAYHDELTSLPSRRAFNEAILRLKDSYSIAVVDIDHFKRFNDTYGHDTGDEVLRLVAANLGRVTGGGQAYRCGGEEFTILFPGKNTAEVTDHLEELRKKIEVSEFRLRGDDRRQLPRGAERRSNRGRRQATKADAIRRLAQEKSAVGLSVTVSIGVASSNGKSDAEVIIKAADRALYKAKENGRNRVETTLPVRRSSRSKAAGIA